MYISRYSIYVGRKSNALPMAPTRRKKLPCVRSLCVVFRLRTFFGVTATSASTGASCACETRTNNLLHIWGRKYVCVCMYVCVDDNDGYEFACSA